MGGKLTILIRKKNGEKVSFKTSTNSMKMVFNDSNVLDQVNFFDRLASINFKTLSAKNMTEHLDYSGHGALFAPYHYGLLMIDYMEKKIFSCNNYCGFMEYHSIFLMTELHHWFMGDVPVPISELNMPIETPEHFGDMDIDRIMRECNNFSPSLNINLAGKPICVSSFGDLLEAILTLKNIDLDRTDVRAALASYCEMRGKKFIIPSDYDVVIAPKGWDIYQGDGSSECVYKAYEHCKAHSILNGLDDIAWADYLEETRKYESQD